MVSTDRGVVRGGVGAAGGDGESGDEARHLDIEATSCARSRDGGLSVVTTAAGLPLSIAISEAHLAKHRQELADDIVGLCRQSSMAAGIRLRAHLQDRGTPPEVIESLGLPTPDDLVDAELRDDHQADAPASWLRSW